MAKLWANAPFFTGIKLGVALLKIVTNQNYFRSDIFREWKQEVEYINLITQIHTSLHVSQWL